MIEEREERNRIAGRGDQAGRETERMMWAIGDGCHPWEEEGEGAQYCRRNSSATKVI